MRTIARRMLRALRQPGHPPLASTKEATTSPGGRDRRKLHRRATVAGCVVLGGPAMQRRTRAMAAHGRACPSMLKPGALPHTFPAPSRPQA